MMQLWIVYILDYAMMLSETQTWRAKGQEPDDNNPFVFG